MRIRRYYMSAAWQRARCIVSAQYVATPGITSVNNTWKIYFFFWKEKKKDSSTRKYWLKSKWSERFLSTVGQDWLYMLWTKLWFLSKVHPGERQQWALFPWYSFLELSCPTLSNHPFINTLLQQIRKMVPASLSSCYCEKKIHSFPFLSIPHKAEKAQFLSTWSLHLTQCHKIFLIYFKPFA